MTTVAALLTGLATSLHCAGMCGPLACGLGTLAKSEAERLTAASLYHGTRLLSYGIIGAVCGALGQQPLKWFFDSPVVLLPWVLVLVWRFHGTIPAQLYGAPPDAKHDTEELPSCCH
jgi:sulfite exporter TauE/SafE